MGWIALVVILVVLAVIILLWYIGTYNRLVQLREMINNAWAQIDVQLKRRYDLIPNLVETVKGYAKHESGTFEAVVQARNAAMSAQGQAPEGRAEAENQLTTTLRSLFALSEAYPELKANQNFLLLQEELTGTEGKIAYSRQHYNDTVNTYNAMIQMFPNSIVAGAGGFTAREYFEIEAGAREVPKVQF
jgi:LemA protein